MSTRPLTELLGCPADARLLLITSDWGRQRQADFDFFSAAQARARLTELSMVLIGCRALRDAHHRLTPC